MTLSMHAAGIPNSGKFIPGIHALSGPLRGMVGALPISSKESLVNLLVNFFVTIYLSSGRYKVR